MATTENNMNLKAQVQAVITEVELNAPLYTKFPPAWKIEFYGNSQVAGKAQGTCVIKINTDLAEKYPEQLRDTVLHEMAHCLTTLKYQRRVKPHGPEWQDMACLIGANPTACHDMEQPDLVVQRHSTHLYRCGCRDHHLKAGRHNKHICYGVIYTCRSCRGPLELIT